MRAEESIWHWGVSWRALRETKRSLDAPVKLKSSRCVTEILKACVWDFAVKWLSAPRQKLGFGQLGALLKSIPRYGWWLWCMIMMYYLWFTINGCWLWFTINDLWFTMSMGCPWKAVDIHENRWTGMDICIHGYLLSTLVCLLVRWLPPLMVRWCGGPMMCVLILLGGRAGLWAVQY